jgi:hypothetical protein
MLPTKDKLEIKRILWENSVTTPTGHWLYRGKINSHGYGIYNDIRVHRLSMWIHKDFDLDSPLGVLHKCDIRNCWNPDHLFEGTHEDNMNDARIKGRLKSWSSNHGNALLMKQKTHCPKGHLLDGIRGNKKRYCKTCNRNRNKNV